MAQATVYFPPRAARSSSRPPRPVPAGRAPTPSRARSRPGPGLNLSSTGQAEAETPGNSGAFLVGFVAVELDPAHPGQRQRFIGQGPDRLCHGAPACFGGPEPVPDLQGAGPTRRCRPTNRAPCPGRAGRPGRRTRCPVPNVGQPLPSGDAGPGSAADLSAHGTHGRSSARLSATAGRWQSRRYLVTTQVYAISLNAPRGRMMFGHLYSPAARETLPQ